MAHLELVQVHVSCSIFQQDGNSPILATWGTPHFSKGGTLLQKNSNFSSYGGVLLILAGVDINNRFQIYHSMADL